MKVLHLPTLAGGMAWGLAQGEVLHKDPVFEVNGHLHPRHLGGDVKGPFFRPAWRQV